MHHNDKRFKIDDILFKPITVDDTKELSVYETYIMNDHNRKIESFEQFKKSVTEQSIKRFCESLTENLMHTLTKYMFAEHYNTQYSEKEIYIKSLRNTYKSNLTDFTVKLPNKTISCLKIVLEQSPFLKIMFEEFKDLNELTLDSDLCEYAIKMLYKLDITEFITNDNFCDVFKLIDKWLLDNDYANVLLPFLIENHKEIIADKSYDEVLVLTEHLTNIKKYHISFMILKHYYNSKVFETDNWPTKYSDEEKIKAIMTAGKYDLLDMSQIRPKKVIKMLRISSLTDVSPFYGTLLLDNVILHYSNNKIKNKNLDNTEIVVAIKSYYPFFKATIFTKTNYEFGENDSFQVLSFDNNLAAVHPFKTLTIGDRILVGNDIKLMCDNHINNSLLLTNIVIKDNDGYMIKKRVCSYYDKWSNIKTNGNANRIGRVWTINEINHRVII